MTSLANMLINVSRDLRDTSNLTFSTTEVTDMINAAIAEIGRFAPARFQSDLTPVADALSYPVPSSATTVPEVELISVELWDYSLTPPHPRALVNPISAEYTQYSQAGWRLWDGTLYLPNWVPVYLKGKESTYKIRVWGYAPYPAVGTGGSLTLSNEKEWALRVYCRIQAMERLLSSRELFSQWQIRSNNTDVTPAALMNDLSLAQADWRRLSRSMTVLREGQ